MCESNTLMFCNEQAQDSKLSKRIAKRKAREAEEAKKVADEMRRLKDEIKRLKKEQQNIAEVCESQLKKVRHCS